MFTRALGFLVRHRRSIAELFLITLTVLVLGFVAFEVDVFETVGHATAAQETIELDETMLLGAALTVGLLIFAWRRVHEVRREIQRRTESERAYRVLASEDPLTGLANRRRFGEALTAALKSPPAAGASHALLMLDLNGFKQVNDVHGHGIGDELLVTVAQRLVGASRHGDVVARLGGDEFAILALHLSGPEAAATIGMRLLEAMAEPMVIEGTAHVVGTGIGVCLFPVDGGNEEEITRRADVALYRAKAELVPSMRFFDSAMDRLVIERDAMERELRAALESDALTVRFQPLIELGTGRITAFEATGLWHHARFDDLPAERFVPIAEGAGILPAVTDRLFREACRAAAQWPADVRLDFAISAAQLRDRTLGLRVLGILGETGVRPGRVEIEITESALVRDMEAAQETLGSLRQAGVRIALDQFGTGYSSLYHLRNFEFDKIKIDRSFISAMTGEKRSEEIVSALIGLGQGLGLTITAEGVDDAEQARLLRAKGCQEAQGKLFGRSVGTDEAARLVNDPLGPASQLAG